MANMTRPDTTNREKLLKALIGQGMSSGMITEILAPMAGKTQEEKEQIAALIMKERGIE